MNKNKITINGVTIEVEGNTVSVNNGRIIVDGKVIKDNLSGNVHVKWEGELARLESDASVECGDVEGNVAAGGSINCKNVAGGVQAGGLVQALHVAGGIMAGGSVTVK